MKKIIIIGSGGHAAEIVDYINYINSISSEIIYEITGIIDESKSFYNHYMFKNKFLGNLKNHTVTQDNYYVIAIGNLDIRKKIIEDLKIKNANFETIIHPTALISSTAEIGKGCLISHNVSIGPKVIISDFCILNSRSTIGHDSQIGENNFIGPKVVTGGFSKIGNHNFLGTNVSVLPKINIGNNNKLMAGMTIHNNINNNETVFYRYKEKLIIRDKIIKSK